MCENEQHLIGNRECDGAQLRVVAEELMFYFYAQWKGEKRSMQIISPKTKNPFKYLPRNKFFH